MLDKELPMIQRKRLPLPQPEEEKESCCDNSACCDAEKTLARLYGDRSIARERCLQVCTQVKKIDEDELTAR